MVRLFFFSNALNLKFKDIYHHLKNLSEMDEFEFFCTVPELRQALRTPKKNSQDLAVLAFDSIEELIDILSLADLLYDWKVILLVPHREEVIVRLSHLLRPRFVGLINDDPRLLMDVIKKIIQSRAANPVCSSEGKVTI